MPGVIFGTNMDDVMFAFGDTQLKGGAGDDVLFAFGGGNKLMGGVGNDFLGGGVGDTLLGGPGDDTFDFQGVFSAAGAHGDIFTDAGRGEYVYIGILADTMTMTRHGNTTLFDDYVHDIHITLHTTADPIFLF